MLQAAEKMTPAELRRAIRKGDYTGHTAGLAPGFLQCNLVILPLEYADDFRAFANANPRSCPLAGISEPGARGLPSLGDDLDIARDAPRYHLYEHGALSGRPADISDIWRDDLVTFAIGCSFTMEEALLRAGISLRHIERDVTVPMFKSNIPLTPAGPFGGTMVVSMRPVAENRIAEASEISAGFPIAHGAPVHCGAPEEIGVADLQAPDWGEAVPVEPGERPLFWACGVTPQIALMLAKLPFAITHAPGAMLVTDRRGDNFTPLNAA